MNGYEEVITTTTAAPPPNSGGEAGSGGSTDDSENDGEVGSGGSTGGTQQQPPANEEDDEEEEEEQGNPECPPNCSPPPTESPECPPNCGGEDDEEEEEGGDDGLVDDIVDAIVPILGGIVGSGPGNRPSLDPDPDDTGAAVGGVIGGVICDALDEHCKSPPNDDDYEACSGGQFWRCGPIYDGDPDYDDSEYGDSEIEESPISHVGGSTPHYQSLSTTVESSNDRAPIRQGTPSYTNTQQTPGSSSPPPSGQSQTYSQSYVDSVDERQPVWHAGYWTTRTSTESYQAYVSPVYESYQELVTPAYTKEVLIPAVFENRQVWSTPDCDAGECNASNATWRAASCRRENTGLPITNIRFVNGQVVWDGGWQEVCTEGHWVGTPHLSWGDVLVTPAYYDYVDVPAEYRTAQRLVRAGYYETRYRQVSTQVWVPGYWG